MKYMDEYRDSAAVQTLARAIRRAVTRPHRIMEICGGQTHAIVKFGLDQLLPPEITLIHGPGCPVCVTPVGVIDKALAIAGMPGVILCSFGDMLRVPGSRGDLLGARADGADVRIVYSPLDAVRIAERTPDQEIVFFAVGFETTAPANALAVKQAKALGLANFSILGAHVLVPPAMHAILNAPECRIDGFLAAGHVCTVMGYAEYESIARMYRVPIVVTGFEPVDILQGVHRCVLQLEAGRFAVENPYSRTVHREGNVQARALLTEVFEIIPRAWRGIGTIPESGLGLRPAFHAFDAERRFRVDEPEAREAPECISGAILRGIKRPADCPAFGSKCTPDHPLGAPMVSGEGACAAYYRYRRENAGAGSV